MNMDKIMKNVEERKEDFYKELLAKENAEIQKIHYRMRVEERTIIMEHNNMLLVRVEGETKMGGKIYKLRSYEIWNDREKYEQNIPAEDIGNQQYIYCSNYATTDEKSMIKIFNAQCKLNDSR